MFECVCKEAKWKCRIQKHRRESESVYVWCKRKRESERMRDSRREKKKEREKEKMILRIIKRIYTLIRNGYYCIICNATHGVSIHIRITKYNAKLARGAL